VILNKESLVVVEQCVMWCGAFRAGELNGLLLLLLPPLLLLQVMPCGLEDRARFFSRLDSLRQETPGGW